MATTKTTATPKTNKTTATKSITPPKTTATKQGKAPTQVHGTARLTLSINGVSYVVKPIPCDPGTARRCYQLRKADGETYHVSEHDGWAECTCADWAWRREGTGLPCKHLAAVMAFGLIVAPVADDAESDPSTWGAWTDRVSYAPTR